jgi:arsenate reductase (glutaredoxin)
VLTIYTYKNCATCRKALKWLNGKNIAHEVKAIRETPPTVAELETALKALGGDLRSLFNTSGNDYRELGMKDRLPMMNSDEAIHLLSGNGNLVKRPFLIGDGNVMVGFNEVTWQQTLI